MTGENARKVGPFRRLWNWFWSPAAKFGRGVIFIGGTIAGVILWGGFNWAMEATNSQEFCMGCHEMADNVGEEWKRSTHYHNPSGVRASCADCHVPKEWLPKVIRKISASRELYGHFTGKIDTPEKFRAHRAEMAERVWSQMIASDSHECRNCHSEHAMNFEEQSARSREKMVPGIEEGKTCIECHKGIAHRLPPRDD